jgi:hypothetical protein
MTVYVAEIEGRGIAAFQADDGSHAERIVRDRIFRDDLMVLTCGGLPVWDGTADVRVRRARADEEARWRASHAKAVRHGDIEGEEEGWIAFLDGRRCFGSKRSRRKHAPISCSID